MKEQWPDDCQGWYKEDRPAQAFEEMAEETDQHDRDPRARLMEKQEQRAAKRKTKTLTNRFSQSFMRGNSGERTIHGKTDAERPRNKSPLTTQTHHLGRRPRYAKQPYTNKNRADDRK